MNTSIRIAQDYLYNHIPITKHLGVKVLSFDGHSVKLNAPLAENINHRDSVFGGSLASVAILSGWTILHLNLLENVKNCIREGRPISHRIKDYPELITDFEEEIAKRLMEITAKAYSDLGIKREWTEYKDAKKALQYQEWGLAVASLKDVLKFLIRSSLESPPNQLLDPNIWCLAEEADLPTNLKRALEFIYDQSFSS